MPVLSQAQETSTKTLTEALRADPGVRDAHRNLAQPYERLGRERDAVRHYAAVKRLTE